MLDDNYLVNLPYKARGIKKMTGYIGNFLQLIEACPHRPVRVLEIGFGFGQVAAELSYLYRDQVELYGINSPQDPIDIDKIIEVARHQAIFPVETLAGKDFLKISYGDAGETLPYPDRYFDVVISQVCIPYIHDKLNVIKEVSRVLTTDGQAWLHAGFEHSRLCNGAKGEWQTLLLNREANEINLQLFFSGYAGFNYYQAEAGSVLKITGGKDVNFNAHIVKIIDRQEMATGSYGISSHYMVDD
jgi:SAM-dependent methyltransferase